LVSLASRADSGGGAGGHRCAGDDEAWFRAVPGRSDAGRTELAEWLLASQGKFAEDVLRATTALPAGQGGTGAKKSGGETKQASPSRAGRARHLR
jgi:hypothetical protein